MTLKQVIQLKLPYSTRVEDQKPKIVQCSDEIEGLKLNLTNELELVDHHPINRLSGKHILTRVALAMGWKKHEFETAATDINGNHRCFFLYYDPQFRDIPPDLFQLITDQDIMSITPGGLAKRVNEKYSTINRKPENLLANFDLLVKGGIGNLFKYVYIPTEHYISAIGYSETPVNYRIMDVDINPNRFRSDHPFMFVNNDIAGIFKVLANKAISRGCVDPYTLQYSRTPLYIRQISRKGKVYGDGCDRAVKLDHATLLSIRLLGHQSQLRFKVDTNSCIRITIDNKVYFPKLYKFNEVTKTVIVNPATLEFIRNTAISKREYRKYAHYNNPKDLNGVIENIPYFFWLYQLLKELDAGILSDWATLKMWAWVESLGFIENRNYPLNTIKRPYITSYLGLHQHSHE